MFGLDGMGVILGFVLTVLSTLLCILYGARNWNRGHISEVELAQKSAWLEEKQQLEESL